MTTLAQMFEGATPEAIATYQAALVAYDAAEKALERAYRPLLSNGMLDKRRPSSHPEVMAATLALREADRNERRARQNLHPR